MAGSQGFSRVVSGLRVGGCHVVGVVGVVGVAGEPGSPPSLSLATRPVQRRVAERPRSIVARYDKHSPLDQSNSYESVSRDFMSIRSRSSTGAAAFTAGQTLAIPATGDQNRAELRCDRKCKRAPSFAQDLSDAALPLGGKVQIQRFD